MTTVSITLIDTNKLPWRKQANFYLVDELGPGCILGVEFLKTNRLGIKWGGENQNDRLQLGDADQHFWATSLPKAKPKLHKNKVFQIRASADFLIQPGTGMTVGVEHPHLPLRADGYLVQPRMYKDAAGHILGAVMNAITDGQDAGLPFANFGELPIRIRKGDSIGTIQSNTVDSSVTSWLTHATEKHPHAIPLSDILGVDPSSDDEPENADDRYGHGYPFNLPDPPDPNTPSSPRIDMTKVNVPSDWPPEVIEELEAVLNRAAPLFRNELGRFNDGILMPINFKEGVDLDDLCQRPYRQSRRDRKAMDSVLDPLRDCGVVESIPLGQPVPVASPAFLVWKKLKPRVVVDLRKVNTKMIGDAYPLPRQDDILGALHGSAVFTVIDVMKGFFQQPIPPEDRWKTAFVTPHRGHEQFTVATMGLKTSPGFFQHRMESLLSKYLWEFVLVYIDDVIIFSRNIEDHLKHLDIILQILAASGCTMSLEKCHFAQHGLDALGVHVSRLGLATTEEKIAAIKELEMPRTLEELEHGIGLMGFQRNWIHHFAALAEPLNAIKTIGFKDCTAKANPARAQYARQYLLPPNPKPPKPNKDGRWKVETGPLPLAGTAASRVSIRHLRNRDLVWTLKKLMHYLDHDDVYVYTDHNAIVQSFVDANGRPKVSDRLRSWRLFLMRFAHRLKIIHVPGRSLVDADALSRLPRKEPGPTPIPKIVKALLTNPVLDSFVVTRAQAKQEAKQAETPPMPPVVPNDQPSTDQQKPDETAPNEHPTVAPVPPLPESPTPPVPESPTPPVPESENNKPDDVTQNGPQPTIAPIPPVPESENQPQAQINIEENEDTVTATMLIADNLTEALVEGYAKDRSFKTVYAKLINQWEQAKTDNVIPPLTFHLFRLDPDTKLMYFMGPETDRLVIPSSQKIAMLRMAHDRRAHQGIQRTYQFLRSFTFFQNMKAFVTDYIRNACPECSGAKNVDNKSYGDLQPIETPLIPISILCMDFIVGLPVSKEGNDAILLIVDKTSKFVKTLVGKTTHTTEDWANLYIKHVYADWGLPDAFVSDVDRKFVSDLWKALCKAAQIDMKVTAAYHHSANGQAERTVQTFMTSMIALLGARLNPDGWEAYYPHVTHCLNTSTSATTTKSPFEMLYGRKPKTFLPVDASLGEDYGTAQQTLRQEAAEATALAQAKMKLYYDSLHHTPPILTTDDFVYVKLAKPGHPGYHLDHQTKLTYRKAGPFPIEHVISPLKYRLKLPPWLKWGPEMSIENLIPARPDKFDRPRPEIGGLTRDGQEKFIIERIEGHSVMKRPGDPSPRLYYRVKWMNYDDPTWEPASALRHDVPKMLTEYHKRTATTAHLIEPSLRTLETVLPGMGL
ncbi:hypothetical protein ONZ43_g1146 [Nemania bipapillata]|uniref:Uncharacterized protein n=1 Tax=Nemania bipapillata TaxID=110536 RepID=A0ACC2J5L4_9PEZI|nr:hypothetical protein ONZ43_g1146 [Nemania bipapillata]